jgi:hypothetical protein
MSGSSSVVGTVYFEWSRAAGNPLRRSHAPNRERPELPRVKLNTYRTKGSPREHGNLQVERRNENIWRAAKPGDVSTQGQSPRSSLRAGKPRTRRRGTVDEYSGAAAGVRGVYRIHRRRFVAPERATQAVRAKSR